jgi:hypothetical protein
MIAGFGQGGHWATFDRENDTGDLVLLAVMFKVPELPSVLITSYSANNAAFKRLDYNWQQPKEKLYQRCYDTRNRAIFGRHKSRRAGERGGQEGSRQMDD